MNFVESQTYSSAGDATLKLGTDLIGDEAVVAAMPAT
jgi:hypothetical protein